MMEQPVILTISSPKDLEQAIVTLSDDELLILDFWAEWCEPCKSLTPVLEQIAAKYAPRIKLAKIDVEKNQMLATQLKVQSIPTVKFVHKGKIVQQFVGAQTAEAVEKLVKAILPLPEDEITLIDEIKSALAATEWQHAALLLLQIIEKEPDNTDFPLMLAKCQIGMGEYDAARSILDAFNDISKMSEKEHLQLLLNVFTESKDHLAEREKFALEDPKNLAAVYDWACALAASGDLPAAFEALLGIIRIDKNFRDSEPRKLLIALFDLAGTASPLVQEYRKRLTKVLFV